MSLEKDFRRVASLYHPELLTDEEKKHKVKQLPYVTFTLITSTPQPKKQSLFIKLCKGLIICTLGLNVGYMIYIFQHPNTAPDVIREYKAYPDFK